MSSQSNRYLFYLVFFVIVFSQCQSLTNGANGKQHDSSLQATGSNTSTFLSCYNLKPVLQDAKYITGDTSFWPGYNVNLKFQTEPIDTFIRHKVFQNRPAFDSSLKYLTSFGYQCEISINDQCMERLSKPDDIFLQQIYFPLQPKPLGKYSLNPVTFEKSEIRDVLNFGKIASKQRIQVACLICFSDNRIVSNKIFNVGLSS